MDAQPSETQAPGAAEANTFTVVQVDMAVENMDSMVHFYETVFDTKLTSYEMGGIKLYNGMVHGIRFVFAPAAIAGVVAEQSRHQFELKVSDIESVARKAASAGGNLRDGIQSDGTTRTLVVEDPDHNTIVFHQKI
jgi:predicted enzyme related to lactoylglutathione lyase